MPQNKVTNRKLVIKPVHRAFWWNRQPPPFHEVFRQCSRFYPDTPEIMRFFSSTNNVMNATIDTTEMALWTIISKDDVWWLATWNSGEHLESMKHTRLWCHVHWVGGEEEVGEYEQQVIVKWWHWNINQAIRNIQQQGNEYQMKGRMPWFKLNRQQRTSQHPAPRWFKREQGKAFALIVTQFKPSVQKSDAYWNMKFYHSK